MSDLAMAMHLNIAILRIKRIKKLAISETMETDLKNALDSFEVCLSNICYGKAAQVFSKRVFGLSAFELMRYRGQSVVPILVKRIFREPNWRHQGLRGYCNFYAAFKIEFGSKFDYLHDYCVAGVYRHEENLINQRSRN